MLELDGIVYTPPPPNGSNGARLHKFKKGVPLSEEAKIYTLIN